MLVENIIFLKRVFLAERTDEINKFIGAGRTQVEPETIAIVFTAITQMRSAGGMIPFIAAIKLFAAVVADMLYHRLSPFRFLKFLRGLRLSFRADDKGLPS